MIFRAKVDKQGVLHISGVKRRRGGKQLTGYVEMPPWVAPIGERDTGRVDAMAEQMNKISAEELGEYNENKEN